VPGGSGKIIDEDILWVRWNDRAREAHPEIEAAIAV
jgi:hypothetical protein